MEKKSPCLPSCFRSRSPHFEVDRESLFSKHNAKSTCMYMTLYNLPKLFHIDFSEDSICFADFSDEENNYSGT